MENFAEIQIPFGGFSLPFHQIQQMDDLAKNAFNAGCRHFCIDAGGQTRMENIDSIMVFGTEEMDGTIFISAKINAGRGIGEELFEKIFGNGKKLDLVFIEIGNEKQRRRKAAEEKQPEIGENVVIIEMDKEKCRKKPMDQILEIWQYLEGKIVEGKLNSILIGLCGKLKAEEIEQIHKKAKIKPKCWMIGLKQFVENFEKIKEMSERLNIRLIIGMENGIGNIYGKSGNGSGQILSNFLRECAKKYGKTATQLFHRWIFEQKMAIIFPTSLNTKRIVDQMNIFDFQICPEDRKRLDDFFASGGNQQIPSPYKISQNWRRRLSSIPFSKHLLPPTTVHFQHQIGIAQKSGSETGRQLMENRRFVGDFALILVLIGIGTMILANEFAFASMPKMEQLLRIGILACTFALIFSILRYHWIELKIYMHQNNVHNWQTALSSRQKTKIIFEILVCSICPIPYLFWPIGDPFLCSLMFLRLYWLPRCLHLHSRLCTDAAAKSIAGLNRVKTDTRFMLKRMLFLYPGLALATFVFNFWLIGAYVLRLCESDIAIGTIQSYYNAIWMMCVTFLTIGYGDIYPVTSCGRLMAIMTGVVGVCVASMIVAVIVQKISLTQAEERVHNFMAKTKHARSLKITAAQVLKESWFIYKNRQNADRDLVRHHERRLSAAICTLRKLRKEQRILAEVDGGTSLDEVAKISQNALELVQAMGNDQRNLNERINGMELKLEEIHCGIGTLTGILMRGMMATENGQIEGPKMGTKLANVQEDGEYK